MNRFQSHRWIWLLILSMAILSLMGCSVSKKNDLGPAPQVVTEAPAVTEPQKTDTNAPSTNLQPPPVEPSKTPEPTAIDAVKDAEPKVSGVLKVHFIDVGQADAILIQQGDAAMMIDAGNAADKSVVLDYLRGQGVRKLDYFVATHPHEDHIGSAASVINYADIASILMPKVTHTTQTFKNMLSAIQAKQLAVTSPKPGSSFALGQATVTVLAPNSDRYDSLNDWSVVLKVNFGNNSFLFTGDAEKVSEQEMLNKGYDLKADVLKVGHHGSTSSTSSAFLEKVNPKYAVISVETPNDYGHPAPSTLERLTGKKITIYRTDRGGTIVATSDGQEIRFSTSK